MIHTLTMGYVLNINAVITQQRITVITVQLYIVMSRM